MVAALYAAGPPPLRGSQYVTLQFHFVPFVLILGALALYVWGVRANNARHPRHRWPAGKTVAFVAALVTTAICVEHHGGVAEAQAAIGLARAETAPGSKAHERLTAIARELYVLIAEVATAPENRGKLQAGPPW